MYYFGHENLFHSLIIYFYRKTLYLVLISHTVFERLFFVPAITVAKRLYVTPISQKSLIYSSSIKTNDGISDNCIVTGIFAYVKLNNNQIILTKKYLLVVQAFWPRLCWICGYCSVVYLELLW